MSTTIDSNSICTLYIFVYISFGTYICKNVKKSYRIYVYNLAFTWPSKCSRAQKPIGLICGIFSVDSVDSVEVNVLVYFYLIVWQLIHSHQSGFFKLSCIC